jgi:hypothetical protein
MADKFMSDTKRSETIDNPLRVTLAETLQASSSCNASFMAAAREFAKGLAKVADAASIVPDSEPTDNANENS